MPKNEIKKFKAIILSSVDVGEYNRIYTVLAEKKGKFSVQGIGVRKPQAKLSSSLEPITKLEIFIIEGRKNPKVVGALIENQYLEVKSDLRKIILVQKVFLAIKKIIPEEEPCDEVFDYLSFYLDVLNKKENNFLQEELAKSSLLWEILRWSGQAPQILKCSFCGEKIKEPKEGEKKRVFFSIPEGLVCVNCQASQSIKRVIEIETEVVKLMRLLNKMKKIIKKIKVKRKTTQQTAKLLEIILLENF